jgi:hypothetical protein
LKALGQQVSPAIRRHHIIDITGDPRPDTDSGRPQQFLQLVREGSAQQHANPEGPDYVDPLSHPGGRQRNHPVTGDSVSIDVVDGDLPCAVEDG